MSKGEALYGPDRHSYIIELKAKEADKELTILLMKYQDCFYFTKHSPGFCNWFVKGRNTEATKSFLTDLKKKGLIKDFGRSDVAVASIRN